MKFYILCAMLFFATVVQAQSKKELLAEVQKLKAEITQLKAPKVIDLENNDITASYGLGLLIANSIKSQGADSVDIEALKVAIEDVLTSKTTKIDQQTAMLVVQDYMSNAMEKKSKKLLEENAAFLVANKEKEGVITTDSGLQYKVISSGKGKSPKETDEVTVHYTGQLIDGSIFDSSVERDEPATFGVNEVIPGWTEALQLMKEGDKWLIYLPYTLAYGERGAGGQIPPYATLIFEVELLKVN
jgi:FKBP-type peptidyl-prolyl cis-trans isomerase